MANEDDPHITVQFYHGAVIDQAATDKAGRKVFRDVEMVKASYPGDISRTNVAPAHDKCFMYRPRPGEESDVGHQTWAQRFPKDYARFKSNDPSAERTGTPLDHVPFMTPARVHELRALNIHTVEALCRLPDHLVTKNSLRPLVEQAKVWLGETEASAAVAEANAKAEAAEARFAALEAKLAALETGKPSDDPDSWDEDRLRAYLTENGASPRANAARDKLVQAVREMREMAA
jgi:hypothetical protein